MNFTNFQYSSNRVIFWKLIDMVAEHSDQMRILLAKMTFYSHTKTLSENNPSPLSDEFLYGSNWTVF